MAGATSLASVTTTAAVRLQVNFGASLLSTVIGGVKTTRTMDATASTHGSDDFHNFFPDFWETRFHRHASCCGSCRIFAESWQNSRQIHHRGPHWPRKYFQLSSLFDVLIRDSSREYEYCSTVSKTRARSSLVTTLAWPHEGRDKTIRADPD